MTDLIKHSTSTTANKNSKSWSQVDSLKSGMVLLVQIMQRHTSIRKNSSGFGNVYENVDWQIQQVEAWAKEALHIIRHMMTFSGTTYVLPISIPAKIP